MTGFRKEIILSSLPFALNIFLMSVIARADGFLLERLHLKGPTEAGIYATGYRIMDAFNMLFTMVAGFLLPFISRNWPKKESFSTVLIVCRQVLMFLAIITAAFALAEPEFITELLYHRKDPETVTVMRIILLALPSLTVVNIFGTVLTATGNIRSFIMLSLLLAISSLLLNVILIPRFGAIGCAATAVLVQSLYAMAINWSSSRRTQMGITFPDFCTYIATAFMFYGAMRLLPYSGIGVLLSASLSALFSALLFFYTTDISFEKIRVVLRGK
jgi:O-antigen/teichoic acid export membrane protein